MLVHTTAVMHVIRRCRLRRTLCRETWSSSCSAFSASYALSKPSCSQSPWSSSLSLDARSGAPPARLDIAERTTHPRGRTSPAD